MAKKERKKRGKYTKRASLKFESEKEKAELARIWREKFAPERKGNGER